MKKLLNKSLKLGAINLGNKNKTGNVWSVMISAYRKSGNTVVTYTTCSQYVKHQTMSDKFCDIGKSYNVL